MVPVVVRVPNDDVESAVFCCLVKSSLRDGKFASFLVSRSGRSYKRARPELSEVPGLPI
jgi:hypothetical protein